MSLSVWGPPQQIPLQRKDDLESKIDLIEESKRDKIIKDFLKKVKYKGNAFNISALNGMGCKSLIFGLYDLIEQKDEE